MDLKVINVRKERKVKDGRDLGGRGRDQERKRREGKGQGDEREDVNQE